MNGLLRDYFPTGTDLALHLAERLAQVARELEDQPRKTLGWDSPAALIEPHLARPAPSATTGTRSAEQWPA